MPEEDPKVLRREISRLKKQLCELRRSQGILEGVARRVGYELAGAAELNEIERWVLFGFSRGLDAASVTVTNGHHKEEDGALYARKRLDAEVRSFWKELPSLARRKWVEVPPSQIEELRQYDPAYRLK